MTLMNLQNSHDIDMNCPPFNTYNFLLSFSDNQPSSPLPNPKKVSW